MIQAKPVEAKPCPCCGSTRLVAVRYGIVCIGCDACGALGPCHDGRDVSSPLAGAIAAWNGWAERRLAATKPEGRADG